jgi:DNA-binding helix-hairpin-helix protein with protein kinase domain
LQWDHKSGITIEAWKQEEQRIGERYRSARVAVKHIEKRETVANSMDDLTEEEWVQRSKLSSEERKSVLEERRDEARENARQEQLLKQQLAATAVKLNEELDRSKAFEERLFMLLEKALQ